ncbi:hypothetical protein M3223_11020 [Paenibacillus pasadenensis]|uniref:hypothetical protein n=1 Tax=Paenibacillus pasadenensis TaxID=217090 RepID=UPI00203CAEBF|nr:hypothetical protein [Paenibacillus pasadenensis]MCM3747883.1 hypothetical protein [Paenibacillus pasadenensis]
MGFRAKRVVLLATMLVLFTLSLVDVAVKKEEMFEAFGIQFLNEDKTLAHEQSRQGITATAENELSIGRDGVREVRLSGTGTEMTVSRATGDSVELTYKVTASALNEDKANKLRDAVKVDQVLRDGVLSLSASLNGRPVHDDAIAIQYTLLLPDQLGLSVRNEQGSVHIEDIQGDVEASVVDGMLEIFRVVGDVSVSSTDGTLYLSEIRGGVQAKSVSSETTMVKITGAAELESESAYSFINEIEGSVTGSVNGGGLHVRGASGPVQLQVQAGDMQVEEVRNDLIVSGQNSSIRLMLPQTGGYKLNAVVTSGKLRTTLPFPVEEAWNDNGEDRVSGVIGSGRWNAKVDATDSAVMIHSD